MKTPLAMIASLLLASTAPLAAGPVQTEVEAHVQNGLLRGTLVLPDAPRAAVVIIPGSGPTNRDGDSPLGVSAGYLRMLGEALGSNGIASIRIDKRGMFGSAGNFGDANAVTFDDYAADARAWLSVATEKAGTNCAWLLGHSEGGLVSLVAAQNAGPELCGVILVAAPGRKMGDVVRAQLSANPANAPLLDDALSTIDALERGETVDVSGFHPALQQLFAPAVQGFLIDGFARDPAALIAALDMPMLIVQGDNDIQVLPADAEALSQARPSAELAIFAGMNHVLKTVDAGDMAANLAAYADPTLPLAPELAETISEFVTRAR